MPGELVRETKEKIFGDIKVVTCRTGIQGYRDGARIKFFREGRSGAWRKMYTTDVTYEAASPSFQVVEAVDDLNGVPVPIACADINGTGAPNFLIREETGEGVSCCIKYHLIYLGIDIRLISLNQPAI